MMEIDTRATSGPIVADKNCEKLHYIAPNIWCAGTIFEYILLGIYSFGIIANYRLLQVPVPLLSSSTALLLYRGFQADHR